MSSVGVSRRDPHQRTEILSHRERDELRRLFVGLVAVLAALGVQMVFSASLRSAPGAADVRYLQRHLVHLATGIGVAFLASRLPPRILLRAAWPAFGTLLLLLLIVLVPGVGSSVKGAQRWLRFGIISLQPSELGRIVFPLLAAWLLCTPAEGERDERVFGVFGLQLQMGKGAIRNFVTVWFPVLLTAPLLLAEPDLGATVFVSLAYVVTLFIGGCSMRYLLSAAIPVIPLFATVAVLRPYQLKRITGFMDTWRDLSSAPWQIRQSLMSLGAGGPQGVGIGNGWQKLSYLPEANTDFVFAVVGEELGLAGTLTVMVLWVGVFLTGWSVLNTCRRGSFEWIFGAGLLCQLVIQALFNVAVVTAMVPPKGVPHPLISYGGSNLVISLASVGFICGMTRQQSDGHRPAAGLLGEQSVR